MTRSSTENSGGGAFGCGPVPIGSLKEECAAAACPGHSQQLTLSTRTQLKTGLSPASLDFAPEGLHIASRHGTPPVHLWWHAASKLSCNVPRLRHMLQAQLSDGIAARRTARVSSVRDQSRLVYEVDQPMPCRHKGTCCKGAAQAAETL